MVDVFSSLLAGFGLSASAGVNAYIPLLILALAAKFTPLIKLSSPYDLLTSWWSLAALTVLLLVEFFADKIPAVNHANDVIQTVIRPAAGAVLFAASAGVISDVHPIVALICGLVVAGGVHVVKSAAVRPVVTATTAGAGNVPISILEDLLATALSILAVVVPILIGAVVVLVTAFVVWWLWRRSLRLART